MLIDIKKAEEDVKMRMQLDVRMKYEKLDPESGDIEEEWSSFKEAILET